MEIQLDMSLMNNYFKKQEFSARAIHLSLFEMERIKKLMRKLNIVDGRNIYDPKKVREMGFSYLGVGR